jgi:hypothetical protein
MYGRAEVMRMRGILCGELLRVGAYKGVAVKKRTAAEVARAIA